MGGQSNGSFSDRTYTQPQPRVFDNNMQALNPMPAMNPMPNFGGGGYPMQMATFQPAPTAQNYGSGGLLGMPQQPQIPGMTPNPKMPGICG